MCAPSKSFGSFRRIQPGCQSMLPSNLLPTCLLLSDNETNFVQRPSRPADLGRRRCRRPLAGRLSRFPISFLILPVFFTHVQFPERVAECPLHAGHGTPRRHFSSCCVNRPVLTRPEVAHAAAEEKGSSRREEEAIKAQEFRRSHRR